MKRIDRRGFLKAVGVGMGSMAITTRRASGAAAPKVARLAAAAAPGGAQSKSFEDFVKYVDQHANGELKVQVFTGGQLGAERDMVESVQMGSIEIGVFGAYVLSNVTPEWGGPLDVPYAIRSQEHLRKVLDGPLAKPMYDAMLQRKGIRHIAWGNRGPRHLTSNKPISSPADLKGVKIRVPEVETYVAAWKMLGATVTPMAVTEMFMGLKQGTIDAQENPLELIYTFSLNEVQKYVNLTAHIYSDWEITVSDRWFKSLSPNLQKVVYEGLVEMGKAEDRYQAADEAELERKLKEKGMTFNAVDSSKFREPLKDLPSLFKTKWKPGFFEEVVALQ